MPLDAPVMKTSGALIAAPPAAGTRGDITTRIGPCQVEPLRRVVVVQAGGPHLAAGRLHLHRQVRLHALGDEEGVQELAAHHQPAAPAASSLVTSAPPSNCISLPSPLPMARAARRLRHAAVGRRWRGCCTPSISMRSVAG